MIVDTSTSSLFYIVCQKGALHFSNHYHIHFSIGSTLAKFDLFRQSLDNIVIRYNLTYVCDGVLLLSKFVRQKCPLYFSKLFLQNCLQIHLHMWFSFAYSVLFSYILEVYLIYVSYRGQVSSVLP